MFDACPATNGSGAERPKRGLRDGCATSEGVERLLRQSNALADFGAAALGATDLDRVLAEGARLCAAGLGVPFCQVLEHRADTDGLVARACVGWLPGAIGRADGDGPGGRAFRAGHALVTTNPRGPGNTALPGIYARHGMVSVAGVPIASGGQRPWGVLEVGKREPRGFDDRDLDFLRGYASVIANAVHAQRRNAAVRAESDARAVLLREQQHRIRNNLMALAAMLQGGERGTADEGSRLCFGEVRRRVFALASLYDHLLVAGLPGGEEASLRDYLASLCAGAGDFHDLAARGIALAFEADGDATPTGVDACTVIGIVVNELVANAVEHAFGPEGGGRIAVGLRRGEGGAVITVEDNGAGVPPEAGGRGLGLSFARKLLERLGCSLALRSAPGRTAWTIVLPGGGRAQGLSARQVPHAGRRAPAG